MKLADAVKKLGEDILKIDDEEQANEIEINAEEEANFAEYESENPTPQEIESIK